MSAERDRREARRAELVARAASDRTALGRRLEPVMKVDRVIERLSALRHDPRSAAIGTGLGLAALLLAMPTGRSPVVRGGIALLQLGASVWRLFTRR